MPLFPRIENPKKAPRPTEADQQLYRRGQVIRSYLVSSPFCPPHRKVQAGAGRYQDATLRQRKRPALRDSREFAMRPGDVPPQLLEMLKRPRLKAPRRVASAELAERVAPEDALLGEDVDLEDDDDDDDEEEENAGGEGAKKGRAAGATAEAKKGAQTGNAEEEEGEEEEVEEDEDEGDYGENYFDNGEDYDEQESGDDEPFY